MRTRHPLIKSPNQVPFRYRFYIRPVSARAFRRLGKRFADPGPVAACHPGHVFDEVGLPANGEVP